MSADLMKDQLRERLAEARAVQEKYVKSEANAEMMNVLVRILETLVDGRPSTSLRKHHHE